MPIRRFDMVFELSIPPKKQRERIIQKACAGLLDASGVARIAESESVAPAVVTRAVSVVCSISDELGVAGSAKAIELLIGSNADLRALYKKILGKTDTRSSAALSWQS